MILINKVTTFASETFQKDLIECISHNIDINSISTIVVFHNNSNIVLPKHDKVKLIIKNKYTDKDIIEYCKKISTDDIFIFSNPFIKFNNTLNNLEKPISTVNKIGNDCFIFNRNEKIIGDSIEDIFQITTQNNKIKVNRKHLWTKEIKIQSLVNKQVSTPLTKIDVVIVSVDYNDFLSITINSIVNLFNITVVTSPNDITCQELCKKYGVNCVITERMYENGAIFNKGKAINEGLKSIKNPDWILLLDADIYLKPDFLDVVKNSNLNINTLVMCKRLIIDNGEDFTKWKNGENVGQVERSKGYGYFQMFNANCQSNRKFFYSEEYTDASESDLEFRDRFKVKSELDTYVVHLGNTGQNWSGRVTEKFTNINLKKLSGKNLVFSLLKDLTYYNENEIKYDNNVDDNSQFIIHISSLYKSNDTENNRRSNLAQVTWKKLYETEKIIPFIKYDNVNNKNIPKIKDLFNEGYNMCINDNDIIMYTNSDICLTEDLYKKVVESCNKYECTFSFRKDFLFELDRPMNKTMIENTKYSGGNIYPEGADLFAVTKSWWEKWKDYLPNDQVIGRPTWDWIFRITMGKSIEGDIVFSQTFEEQGTICETPNISYHESHNSYWERPENLLDKDSIKNSRIAYYWMKEKSNNINFTGKEYFEKTYGENLN
jgi:hypothetical protein